MAKKTHEGHRGGGLLPPGDLFSGWNYLPLPVLPLEPPGELGDFFCGCEVEPLELPVPAEPLEVELPEAAVLPLPAGRSQALRKPARASAVTMERIRFMGCASPFSPVRCNKRAEP